MFSFTEAANPFATTMSVYVPGGRFLNSYEPCWFVTVSFDAPLADRKVAVAPATTAPDGSVTWP
jgi:hypothetical protein